jgi:hypothetical protein
MENMDDLYYEDCCIAAAEMVGPNSMEYEGLVDHYFEDDSRRKTFEDWYNTRTDWVVCDPEHLHPPHPDNA